MGRKLWIVLIWLVAFCSGCQELRFQLSKEPGYGAITGRVLDVEGKPLGNAEVAVEPSFFGLTRIHKTNAEGEFLLTRVRLGKVMVLASKVEDGYPDVRSALFVTDLKAFPTVTVEEGKITRNVVVRLAKGGKLVGSIKDSKNGLPVISSRIHLYRLDMPVGGDLSTDPDEQGHFEFALPPRPFRMEVTAPGYKEWTSQVIQLPSGSTKELTISLDPVKAN